jgi:hypothetical protein
MASPEQPIEYVERTPYPLKVKQLTKATCWAGAMMSWLTSTGALTAQEKHLSQRNLINFYRELKWTDHESCLILNNEKGLESFREESIRQEIWTDACRREGRSGGRTPGVERKEGRELSYDYFAAKLKKSYVLVAEKRDFHYKHVYVVFRVEKYSGDWVEIMYMDPNHWRYERCPLAAMSSYLTWIAITEPSAGQAGISK